MTRKQLRTMLTVLIIVDGFVVGALLCAVASPAVGIPVGLAAMLVPFVLVAGLIVIMLRIAGWGGLSKSFPAVPQAEGTRAKVAPTFVVGKLPMNNAIEWASDDDHLHITPVFGWGPLCAPVSVPWEHIEFPDRGEPVRTLLAGSLVQIRAGGVPMRVPAEAVSRELEIRRAIENQTPEAALSA